MAAVLGALAIPVVAFVWWLGSPLFFDKTVDEEFPLTVGADIPAEVDRADAEVVMETAARMDCPMTEAMPIGMEAAIKLRVGLQGRGRFSQG